MEPGYLPPELGRVEGGVFLLEAGFHVFGHLGGEEDALVSRLGDVVVLLNLRTSSLLLLELPNGLKVVGVQPQDPVRAVKR